MSHGEYKQGKNSAFRQIKLSRLLYVLSDVAVWLRRFAVPAVHLSTQHAGAASAAAHRQTQRSHSCCQGRHGHVHRLDARRQHVLPCQYNFAFFNHIIVLVINVNDNNNGTQSAFIGDSTLIRSFTDSQII